MVFKMYLVKDGKALYILVTLQTRPPIHCCKHDCTYGMLLARPQILLCQKQDLISCSVFNFLQNEIFLCTPLSFTNDHGVIHAHTDTCNITNEIVTSYSLFLFLFSVQHIYC